MQMTTSRGLPRLFLAWFIGDRRNLRPLVHTGLRLFEGLRRAKTPACNALRVAPKKIEGDKGTVPVVANGGIGDTTGTVLPFGEERQEHDSASNLGHL